MGTHSSGAAASWQADHAAAHLILPMAVAGPVPVTMARARPAVMTVPCKHPTTAVITGLECKGLLSCGLAAQQGKMLHVGAGSMQGLCSAGCITGCPVALLTEKRMQVLSWYTALGPAVGSRCFSTLPLSPVRTDCSSTLEQSAAAHDAGQVTRWWQRLTGPQAVLTDPKGKPSHPC